MVRRPPSSFLSPFDVTDSGDDASFADAQKESTKKKNDSFKAAAGTILFFEDKGAFITLCRRRSPLPNVQH